MQKKNWLLISLCLLTTMSIAQNVRFYGTVSEQKSTEPIFNANVYFKGTTLGTVTNSKGNFEIKNVKPGKYQLVVSSIGYHRISRQISIEKDSEKLNFTLEKSNSNLGEVVVTGTGTPHHLKSAPVQTELINKKLVEEIAPSGFTDLMTSISPSFDFSPGSMGPFMQLNGLGNDYILVLIDGKRAYGDIGGQTDLNRINPDNVERIEVVKGASSALYGSDAIAGVINIITKKSNSKVHINNKSRLGDYGEWIQSNSLDLNLGRFSSSTSVDRKQTDGWKLSPYEIDGNDLVETDAMAQNKSEDYTINQQFLFAPTQKLKMKVQGSKYKRNIERPESVGKYGYVYDDFSYAAGADYLLNQTNKITLNWHSDRFNYFYKYNQNYKDYTVGEEVKQTQQVRDGLDLKGIFKLTEHHQLSVGGEYINEKLESEGRLVNEKADAYTVAAFAQDEMKFFKNLSLVVGARFVNHKEFGSAFTPKVSALYKIKDLNLRATYARGFKTPTLKELYYHYVKKMGGSTYLYLGNTDLDPQTSNYYSASAEYIINGFSVSITAYKNNVNDLIAYETVDIPAEDAAEGVTKARKHYNISEASTQGFDFIFNANLGGGFSVGGGYSYVDAQNKTEDIRLEGVAENYGNIRFGYQHQWKLYHLNATVVGRFQDDKFYDDGNAKAYNLWKFTTTHQFKTNSAFDFELNAGIDNLFDYVDDSPYGSHYGTINPGRTFFVGLNINFAK